MLESNHKSSEGKEVGSIRPQIVVTFIVSMAYMSAGSTLGWTSPTLPLLEEDHYIVLSKTEEAWISALVSMSAILGPLVAGLSVPLVGYKVPLICTAALYLVGWVCVAAARSAGLIYAGRFILGLCTGVSFTIPPIYIGEISQAKIRGALGSLSQLFCAAGLLFEYVVGPWSSYVMLAASSAVMPAVLLVGMFFVPDSPYQLIRRGKTEEARKAFMWLRGKTILKEDKEMQDIEADVAKTMQQKSSARDLVDNRATVKALLLSQGFAMFQQLSGANAVQFYAQTILSGSVSSLRPSVATIIFGVVMLVASVVTPLVVERAGRRMLLLASAAGMSLSLFVLGAYFYLTNTHVDTSSYGFVPTLSLITFIIVYSTGFGPLTWVVSAELFAPNVRSSAASFTASTCWFFSFLVTFFFQSLVDNFGSHVVFWVFAGCCFFAGVFVFFLLPETKGRTFSEIQDLLGA